MAGLHGILPCPSTENTALEKQPLAGSSQPAIFGGFERALHEGDK
jgi:hypothetical protein